MGKRTGRSAPHLPDEFHGISIAGGRLRHGDGDWPLMGVTATVRDESTETREVTASGIAAAAAAILTTDQIDWTARETTLHGQVVVAVQGQGFAFEVPVPAAERRAAKEFVVAIRVAVKAAEATG